MVPFLAQFAELMDGTPSMGTQTGTRATEDPDSDEDYQRGDRASYSALGTRTVTEIGGEDADEDVGAALGTQTMTKATNEDPDADPGLDAHGMWEASVL